MTSFGIKKTFYRGMIVSHFLGIFPFASADSFSGAATEVAAGAVENGARASSKPLQFKTRQMAIHSPDGNSEGVPLLRAAPYPTGYTDTTMFRCFTIMPPVNFVPQFKYKEASGTGGAHFLYGFTVPLVGDLNGDGKPEIVAINLESAGINAATRSLFIFNGQTGAEIAKFPLPGNGFTPVPSGYHGSPSQIALVDADRNGKAEIIVCFSRTSNETYRKQIASFEVNDNTFNSSVALTSNTKLTEKWRTTVRYDAWGATNGSTSATNDYDYPLPQIVDVNADGTPEIIVYNKIYNAVTGAYIMKFEELGSAPGNSNKTANVGSYCLTSADIYAESSIAFSSIYDIDGDGIYDYIAGGKIYHHINLTAGTYQTLSINGVPDGRTAVADIDGDGRAEIVVQTCTATNSDNKDFTLRVWRPNFQTNTGELLAQTSFHVFNDPGQGFSSYIYIGDIDGKTQNGHKLPEISILTGRPYLTSGTTMNGIPVHPNVLTANGGDGLIKPSLTLTNSSVEGCLLSFTWDNAPGVTAADRLKMSFMLEHDDRSINTGFSLFDFDNDGVKDICYRDEQYLRIISAKKSYIKLTESATDVIRLKAQCYSYTGYEYPAIADVDGDGSADMVVVGRSSGGTNNPSGYIFVVEGANGDLAPAPSVWNQFHYHPMKINENLQTPLVTFRPLDPDYRFYEHPTDQEPIYFYNSNIMQSVISSSFIDANGKEIVKPVVFTPDAKILDANINTGAGVLNFKVTNTGNATLRPTVRVRIYRDGALVDVAPQTIGAVSPGGLYPGDTIAFSYKITNTAAVYDIVIGGTLANGLFTPGSGEDDCNWADNRETVALFLTKEDLATVAHYGTTVIDVLANDVLLTPCNNQTLTPEKITTIGGVGVLSGNFGTIRIVNNKLMYTAPAPSSYNGVVDFTYSLTCEGITRTAHVYIYLLESCTNNFVTCAGSTYTVCLKRIPGGIKFRWYDAQGTYLGLADPALVNPTSDTTFYAKPDFSDFTVGTWAAYRTKDFPPGQVNVSVLGLAGVATARWTGAVNMDWYNPGNWEHIVDGKPCATPWAPNNDCVDVVIGENCPHYPELTAAAACRNIHLESRAMLAGIHHLAYVKASIDFAPVPSEKNRFVMWSAPLKDMYTGDYHFLKADLSPDWGLIYMNFFQSSNPDYPGSVAEAQTYTATFGSMGTPLPLGKAFNVDILPDTRGKRFRFPSTFTSYTGANGEVTGTLARGNSGRFITDGVMAPSGALALPVDDTYSLIQVVNPFAAYLKVNEFLTHPDNTSRIENAYKMWNGKVNEDLITVLARDTMRAVISDDLLPVGTEALIAPFQSFFVMKKAGASFGSLTMNASMTTTVGTSSRFTLRSSPPKMKGILRITVKQQLNCNTTVLIANSLYKTGEASGGNPQFTCTSSRKAFLNGVPVSVYTLSDDHKALSINLRDGFDAEVGLGIRVKNMNVPVSFDFSGVEGFGREVFLIDHELNDRVIDLQLTPEYTFNLRNYRRSDNMPTELNDRFSLRFGNPTRSESIDSDVIVRSGRSRIDICSTGGMITGIEIYDMSGINVYKGNDRVSSATVSVTPNRLYFVKVFIENKPRPVRKVMVLP
jgi:hypothetical protein